MGAECPLDDCATPSCQSAVPRDLTFEPRCAAPGDLAHATGLDLVHEPPHLVLPRDEGAGLDPRNRLADVLLEIVERLRGPGRPHARLVLDLATEIVVLEGQHSTVRVVDEHDLLGSEKPLRYRERADLVVGDHAAGVADDVGVALFESEQRLRIEARIHAGDDRDPPGRGQWKLALVEALRVGAGVLEQFVDDGHRVSFRRRSGRCYRK